MNSGTSEAEDKRWSEAVAWVALLDQADQTDLSHEHLRAFRNWTRDARNIQIFDQVTRLEGDRAHYRRRAVPSAAELQADAYDASMSVEAWQALEARKLIRKVKSRSPWYRSLAAAAAVAIVGAAAVIAYQLYDYGRAGISKPWARVYQTRLAANQQFHLPDGSRMSAAGLTRISVRYTKDFREVFLDRGEALFEVGRDKARPFRVYAGVGCITALGTSFNVRHDGPHVSVTVIDGTVEVRPTNPAPTSNRVGAGTPVEAVRWQPIRLARGHRMAYEDDGQASPVERARVAEPSWQYGQLRFERERLRSVIEAVNRYSRRRIVLDDAAAGDYLYSGSLLEGQVEDWIAGLERIYPVRVAAERPGEVHISSLSESEPRPTAREGSP